MTVRSLYRIKFRWTKVGRDEVGDVPGCRAMAIIACRGNLKKGYTFHVRTVFGVPAYNAEYDRNDLQDAKRAAESMASELAKEISKAAGR